MSIEIFKELVPEDKWEKFEEAYNDNVGGLRENRDKLKSEKLRKQKEAESLREELEELKKKLDKVDLSEYNTLKEDAERRKLKGESQPAPTNSDEMVELQMQLKKVSGEHDRILKELEAERNSKSNYEKMIVEREKSLAIRNALDKLSVDNESVDILMKAYKGQAEAKIEDGKTTVFMRDDEGEPVDVQDFFRAWSETKTAKKFITVPTNSGGSATGGSNRGSKSWGEMNLDERTKLYKENPTLAKQLQQNK